MSLSKHNQNQANYDARKYPLCAPFDGTIGITFRLFADSFLTSLAVIDLKDPNEVNDLSEHLIGTDEGGDVAPPGAAAPLPIVGAPATRRRTKRAKFSFTYIYNHVTCPSLRKMLIDEAYNNGRLAWQLLVRECDEPTTDLELEDLKRNVRELTIISTVGCNEHSISKFRRVLSDENGKIPDLVQRIDENELCLILLRCISTAAVHLAADSDTELKASAGSRKFVYPPGSANAGERSIARIVQHFDPLWKSAIQRGTIPMRVPTSNAGGLRFDSLAACAETEDGDGYDLPPPDAMRPGMQLSALAAVLAKPSSGKRLSEVICWNCKGLGHPKSKCPSVKYERAYAAVIQTLTSAMSRNTCNSTAPAPLPLACRGPEKSGGARRSGSSDVSAYLMTDGTFVLSTGEQAEWTPAEDAPLSLPDELTQDDEPNAADKYEACNAVRIIEWNDLDWPTSDPAGGPS